MLGGWGGILVLSFFRRGLIPRPLSRLKLLSTVMRKLGGVVASALMTRLAWT